MSDENAKSVVVIVAHPDDETLWAGGEILQNPSWNWYIISLCRKNDEDRAPRFYRVLKKLNAKGNMGDLDDGPEQKPLNEDEVEKSILNLLPHQHYDIIMTHNPTGEYTRHLRHEEISKAVISLWKNKKIYTNELWLFAYEDGNKKHYPTALVNANPYKILSKTIFNKKYHLITRTYGYKVDSWEAKATPKEEGFWRFTNEADAVQWLHDGGKIL